MPPVDPTLNLIDLVPHRGPMRFLDKVISYDAQSVQCMATIRPDNPLLEVHHLPGWALLEYLAQAAGLLFSLTYPAPKSTPWPLPTQGYLAIIKDAQFTDHVPSVDQQLEVTVHKEVGNGGSHLSVVGEVLCQGKWVCRGVLILFLTPAKDSVLRTFISDT